jgi:serine/threonine-protein kinase RsbW
MKAEFSRRLTDGRAGFPSLLEAVEDWLDGHGVPPGAAAPLMIACDEIISNVLSHGGKSRVPAIDVALTLADGAVGVEISDDGTPFDPLSAPPPDTTLPVEDRPIGGLGVHLVRELMDEVSYRREGGWNRLRFSKNCSLG